MKNKKAKKPIFLGNIPKSPKYRQRSPTINFFRKGIRLATPPPQKTALSLPGHKKGHLGNPNQNNSINTEISPNIYEFQKIQELLYNY